MTPRARSPTTVSNVRIGWRPFGRSTIDPVRVDQTIAVVLTILAQWQIWSGAGSSGRRLAAAALSLVITLPVAVRRRWPVVVGTVVPALCTLEFALFGGSSIAYPLANFFALYALAVWTPTRQFVLGTIVFVVAVAATATIDGFDKGTVQYLAVVVVVMLFVRRIVGDRERRAELAERERDVASREAVFDERARIARELHDAIAHNVSMMVLQAGAERHVLSGDAGGTREVLEGIERTGRSALVEMRRLVGMLRTDKSDPLAPQPGLRDLPILVTQLREAGLPVDLAVDGAPNGLPVGIELSAYRIVQEALTNVLKHAGDAHATVRVRYTAEALELEITDDGRSQRADAISGGHGLVGMRERVALYGGQLTAGGRPGGGFAVNVVLPVR
jgi:signal transduction histidine kinase